MVLVVSYSRVLGQRPTLYCPLLAVSCPEVWARMYRHIYTVQSMYNVHTKKQKKNNNTTNGRWSHRWSHPTSYLSSYSCILSVLVRSWPRYDSFCVVANAASEHVVVTFPNIYSTLAIRAVHTIVQMPQCRYLVTHYVIFF